MQSLNRWKNLCLVSWAITRAKSQLGTGNTTTRRAPTCSKTIKSKWNPIMHMKCRICQPRISVLRGPKRLDGGLYGLRSELQSCGPMSWGPAKKIWASNSLPIFQKVVFTNRCSSSDFKHKSSSTLSPFATKQQIPEIESKVKLIYF